MPRMTWTLTANGHYLSGDARFEVGGPVFIGTSTYVRLFDQKTGKEYPCRTVESAKAGARSLLRVEELSARELLELREVKGELLTALKALADKVDATSDCDHKRQSCEDIGCIGHEVRIARAAIKKAEQT